MAKKTSLPAKAKASARKPAIAKANVTSKKTLVAKAKPTTAKAVSAEASPTKKNEGKKISAKLLQAIEKRQTAKADNKSKPSPFGRPMGRRGRRPKRLAEYTPTNGEEGSSETVEQDNQNEGLEYDTGIRVKEVQTEDIYSMDRFEDFDEELNFDR